MSIGVGVIGLGYWGPNLVRNIAETEGARLVAVADSNAERLSPVARRYAGVDTTSDGRELLMNPQVDAVVIATPVSTHFPLAMAALDQGKHVFVEKPLASTSVEARRLIDRAAALSRVLMVGHTFVYASPVREIAARISSNELGEILYYDAVRINLGIFQHDVNVVWDLAVHDLSILDYLLPCRPIAVSATAMSHTAGPLENVAYLTLFFQSSLIAHIHVNWLAPVKIRRTLIGGSSKMIVYDDLEPSEKVKIYDRGITVANDPVSVHRLQVEYRSGDMLAPRVEPVEALRTEVSHFIRCIEQRATPISDGAAGLRVVQVIEAASLSIAKRGSPVAIASA